jgi:hypothetical protein
VAELHPQVAALAQDSAALQPVEGPEALAAMRADYVETAMRLGGALEEVGGVEDVVIVRGDGAEPGLPARAYRPRSRGPGGPGVFLGRGRSRRSAR